MSWTQGERALVEEIRGDVKVHLKHHESLDALVKKHDRALFGWTGLTARVYLLMSVLGIGATLLAVSVGAVFAKIFGQ